MCCFIRCYKDGSVKESESQIMSVVFCSNGLSFLSLIVYYHDIAAVGTDADLTNDERCRLACISPMRDAVD